MPPIEPSTREASANAFTLRWHFADAFARYMEEEDRQFGAIIHSLEKDTVH